ncbi:MAG: ABC transporter ATP-binding protein [Bacillota bacterium]
MPGWLSSLLINTRLSGFMPLLKYLKSYRTGMFLAVLAGALSHFAGIGGSAMGAYLVSLSAIGEKSISDLTSLIIVLGCLVTARAVMRYSEMWIAHEVAFKILVDFRIMLYKTVEKIAPAYMTNVRSGEMASTLMADVELLEWFFAHTAGSVVVALIVPSITLIALGMIHWLLPIVLIPWIIVIFIVPLWLRKKADQQGQENRRRLASVNAEAVDGVQGLKEIVTFNYEQGYLKRLARFSDLLGKSQIDYGNRLGMETAILNSFWSLAILSVLSISAYLVITGQMALPWLTVAVILSIYIFAPILEVCATASNFGLILAASERVFNVLESRPEVQDYCTLPPAVHPVPEIAFKDVHFKYRPELPDVLKGTSFTVKKGEYVALVGHSGAGKTTCINLLLRYYDVDKGSINIGQQNIKEFPQEYLRSLITIVPQDIYLFNTSIRENIRLGNLTASDEEVEKVAQAALIHDFIIGLPEGYDTVTGERGIQLSGGQKQRIAIARALLKDAPILVLDEALSSLDTENERLLQKSIAHLRQGKTTLVIAHRLSTFLKADRLVVLNNGQVVETGSHYELFNRDSYYRRFVSLQATEIA